jgi:Domain of unknown function (DUF6265)
MIPRRFTSSVLRPLCALLVALFVLTGAALAQALAPAQESAAPANAAVPASTPSASSSVSRTPDVKSLAWLQGCWQGSVNKRDFREVWLPQHGDMMIGVSQTVMDEKTIDYEYLRIENRPDGAYYVVSPPGKAQTAFKLTEELVDKEDGAHTFVFIDPAGEFPRRIGYRRATQGWLYTEVEGKVNGAERKVIYPMHHVNCETGEVITK